MPQDAFHVVAKPDRHLPLDSGAADVDVDASVSREALHADVSPSRRVPGEIAQTSREGSSHIEIKQSDAFHLLWVAVGTDKVSTGTEGKR